MRTVDDLAPWAQRALEAAYERRERQQASREDFAAGFIAALEYLHSESSFKRDANG